MVASSAQRSVGPCSPAPALVGLHLGEAIFVVDACGHVPPTSENRQPENHGGHEAPRVAPLAIRHTPNKENSEPSASCSLPHILLGPLAPRANTRGPRSPKVSAAAGRPRWRVGGVRQCTTISSMASCPPEARRNTDLSRRTYYTTAKMTPNEQVRCCGSSARDRSTSEPASHVVRQLRAPRRRHGPDVLIGNSRALAPPRARRGVTLLQWPVSCGCDAPPTQLSSVCSSTQ